MLEMLAVLDWPVTINFFFFFFIKVRLLKKEKKILSTEKRFWGTFCASFNENFTTFSEKTSHLSFQQLFFKAHVSLVGHLIIC